MHIAVLLTCHNRREKTVACLEALFRAEVPEDVALDVYLIDDGSTDCTADAVRSRFPHVHIHQGDGNLYWSGGMRAAWSQAIASGVQYEAFLWLNDDTFVYSDAVLCLIESFEVSNRQALLCATVVSSTTGEPTYGGKDGVSPGCLRPTGGLTQCKITCGNCVLIPRVIFERIGMIDSCFTHAIGDFDYSLRVAKAGFKCFILPKAIGVCDSNPQKPRWCQPEIPFRERLANLYSPLGYAQPRPYFIYNTRHFGLYIAFKDLLSAHVRVFFPSLWKHR